MLEIDTKFKFSVDLIIEIYNGFGIYLASLS